MPALPPGVTIEDLRAVVDAAGDGPVLVALSGGGDSTALLHLLADIAPKRLIAGVVDHALRAGSADDAQSAAEIATQRGVRAEIMRLSWSEGAKRAQAAFRAARYEALAACAQRNGARIIALGHTRDDQAETAAMRAARGGVGGMRRFAPAPVWPEGAGIALARPLLSTGRAALRAWLTERGARWIEDPSNEDTVYERVRIRCALRDAEVVRLAEEADSSAATEVARDRDAAAWIAAHVRFNAGRIAFAAAPPPRALGALAAAAAGRAQIPPAAAVARLAARMAAPGFRGAALGGARISAAQGAFLIRRDPGAVFGRAGTAGLTARAIEEGAAAVWDGRVRVTARAAVKLEAGATDPDAPLVRAGGAIFSLTDAEEAGLVRAEWLLAAHVSHILFTPP